MADDLNLLEVDPAVKAKRLALAQAHDAWSAANTESNTAIWAYKPEKLDAFVALLAELNLTAADLKMTDAQIDGMRVRGHLKAARECWRLSFKNESMWSPAERLAVMDEHLAKAGKTRADIGLFDDSKDIVYQAPDLDMALMNPGRLKYVHHLLEGGVAKIFDYDPATQTFQPRKQ